MFFSSGKISPESLLSRRSVEGLRVLTICLSQQTDFGPSRAGRQQQLSRVFILKSGILSPRHYEPLAPTNDYVDFVEPSACTSQMQHVFPALDLEAH